MQGLYSHWGTSPMGERPQRRAGGEIRGLLTGGGIAGPHNTCMHNTWKFGNSQGTFQL